ncbi:hypothetical protein K474DRAFT_15498 [Panus rudis PR-1116 ss-1]|nr:hypothetical protein K474DRAFT_15498 [Panus rudis PR-1116 ss-1]
MFEKAVFLGPQQRDVNSRSRFALLSAIIHVLGDPATPRPWLEFALQIHVFEQFPLRHLFGRRAPADAEIAAASARGAHQEHKLQLVALSLQRQAAVVNRNWPSSHPRFSSGPGKCATSLASTLLLPCWLRHPESRSTPLWRYSTARSHSHIGRADCKISIATSNPAHSVRVQRCP